MLTPGPRRPPPGGRALLGLVLLPVLLLGACSRSAETTQTPDGEEAPFLREDRVHEMRYSAKVSGDLTIDFSEHTEVRVLRFFGEDRRYELLYLLSVGPPLTLSLPDGSAFRVAFDVVRFAGTGVYQITGSPRDLAAAAEGLSPDDPPDQSNMLLQLWVDGDLTKHPEVFDDAVQPCRLVVEDDGMRGELLCPRVEHQEDGRAVTVEMSWGETG